MNNNIHPFVRIGFLILTISGIILLNKPSYILAFYLVTILPLISILGLGKNHYRLLLIGILPIFLSFILIYIIIMDELTKGWDFVILRSLKILVITSTFQISLSIPPDLLLPTFKKWGFKGSNLQTLLGAFTVWADIRTRTNQIITARFARGFIGKRTMLNTSRQLPYILLPMIIGVLRTSQERVKVWDQINISELIKSLETESTKYPFILNALVLLTGCLLVGFGLYYRL